MADSFDITLAQGETSLNGMCALQDGLKRFRVYDSPMLPEQILTTIAEPSYLSPDKVIRTNQVDWRRGLQQRNYADPYMYASSENVDARAKGQVSLSPKCLSAYAFTGTVGRAVSDDSFEKWNTEDTSINLHWTKTGAGTLARTTDKNSGVYAADLDGDIALYQDLPFCSDDEGEELTLSAYLKANSSDTITITIDDGLTTSSTNCTDNSYTSKSVSHTIGVGATQLRIQISTAASNGGKVDDVTVTGGSAFPDDTVDQVQFGDTIVGAHGDCLYQVIDSVPTYVKRFGVPITDLCVFTSTEGDKVQKLYIALGWDWHYWYTEDLTDFFCCTLTYATAKHFSNVGGGAQLWISNSNSTVIDSDIPYAGGTEFAYPAYQVGSDDYDITSLVDDESGVVFIKKQNNIYYLSGEDVLRLIPELECEANTSVDYKLYEWQGKLYIPSGVNSLYEYDNGTVTNISISQSTGDVANAGTGTYLDILYAEEVLAMCGDNKYLYVAVNTVAYTYVFSGSWETIGGETNWAWHLIYCESATVGQWSSILISSSDTNKRLYAGLVYYEATETTKVLRIFKVPDSYMGALIFESGMKYTSSGDFFTPWFRSEFPTEDKYWETVSVTSICVDDESPDVTTSITVYYQKAGDTDWTSLGSCTNEGKEIVSSSYPTETTDTFNIRVSSTKIRFRFKLETDNDDYTPILFGLGGGITVTGILMPERIKIIEFTLYIADKYRERGGSVKTRTISTDKAACRTLYSTLSTAITITAPDSASYTGFIARGGYEEQLVYDEVGRNEAWLITFKIMERYDA